MGHREGKWLIRYRFFEDGRGILASRPCYDAGMAMLHSIDPLTALAVVLATALTDAVYVLFTAAVMARRRLSAATWSSLWYMLSSFAVISYTENWTYVAFAALGSWLGAFASITFLHDRSKRLPP